MYHFMLILLTFKWLKSECGNIFDQNAQFRTEMGFIEIENFTSPKRIFCLAKCANNTECNQAIFNYETKNCSLNSGYISDSNILTSKNRLYTKIYESKQQSECVSDFEYWSKKINACIPCPKGFTRASSNPFACFHVSNTLRKFFDAKVYCEQIGSFLPRPNSTIERQTLANFDQVNYIWVDSYITRVGQQYRWGDGSSIFGSLQINNYGGGSRVLRQDALGLRGSSIFDNSNQSNSRVICQIS